MKMTKALRLFLHFIDLLLHKNDNKFINKKLLFIEAPFICQLLQHKSLL